MAVSFRSVVLALAVLATVAPAVAKRSCRRACRPLINQCERQCRRENKGSPGIVRGCHLGCKSTILNDCYANGADAACPDATS